MTSRFWVMGLAAACALGFARGAAAAPTCNNPQVLHFPSLWHGGSSAVVERRSSVGTDRQACYQFSVRGGARTLTVKLFSNDPAGFLRIYSPDWTTRRDGPSFAFSGPTLPGAGPGDHATHWKGPAPLGNVLVVVELTGAGRQYRLRVEAY
jgi:hypothetical protein